MSQSGEPMQSTSSRLPSALQSTLPSGGPRLGENLHTGGGVILYVDDLTVSFDGFRALDNLSLYIDKGELRCLIGANGAGKTTLMDVITGKTRPDSGSVYLGDKHNLLQMSTSEIVRLGVGRKFQKPTVFNEQSVFVNLELSLRTDKRVWPTLTARLSDNHRDRIHDVLNIIGLTQQTRLLAGALSHGQKQWLEIGMLLVSEPILLLIDEPVAGMTHAEADRTAQLLTDLAGDHTVVVVEHDMEFVRSIAQKVTVLHQGSVLMEGDMSKVQNDPDVREVYLGSEA